MRFGLVVIGVFAAVFIVMLSFRAPQREDAASESDVIEQAMADAEAAATIVSEPRGPTPTTAWDYQEDPIVHQHRISAGMTLAAVKAHHRDYAQVKFRRTWAVNTGSNGTRATMVCGEVSATGAGEPDDYKRFIAAGASLTTSDESNFEGLNARFCAPDRRVVQVRYGEFAQAR